MLKINMQICKYIFFLLIIIYKYKTMSITTEIMKYSSKSLIGGGIMMLYNVIVEGRNITNDFTLRDTYIMAGSVLSSSVIYDIIDNLVDIPDKSILKNLIEPLINSFIYSYAYDKYLANFYRQQTTRDNMTNYLIGGVVEMLSIWLSNPLILLFNGIHY